MITEWRNVTLNLSLALSASQPAEPSTDQHSLNLGFDTALLPQAATSVCTTFSSFPDLLKWDSLRSRSKTVSLMIPPGWYSGRSTDRPSLPTTSQRGTAGVQPSLCWQGPGMFGRDWERASCLRQPQVLSMYHHRDRVPLGVTHSFVQRGDCLSYHAEPYTVILHWGFWIWCSQSGTWEDNHCVFL